jgi:hypothetical protein
MRHVEFAGIAALALTGAIVLTSQASAEGRAAEREAPVAQLAAKKARKAPESPKAEATETLPVKPNADEDFTYALKTMVKAKSSAFCDRYGSAGDCIQDIEICLTMLDKDDDTVRVCMSMAPTEANKPRTASVRR